jgi:hypothetical protein
MPDPLRPRSRTVRSACRELRAGEGFEEPARLAAEGVWSQMQSAGAVIDVDAVGFGFVLIRKPVTS